MACISSDRMGALNLMEARPVALAIPLSPPSFPIPWLAHEALKVHQQCSPHKCDRSVIPNNASEDKEEAISSTTTTCISGNGGEEIAAEPMLVKSRRRPTRLAVPEYFPANEFSAHTNKSRVDNVELLIQGRDYCLVSKKGRRQNMEDRYRVITDISGDPNQAFFAVIDGHGGHEAADYVANNLGKNILAALDNLTQADQQGVEQAIHRGYLQTDTEFLSQGLGSGACAASVLLRNQELHAANVGDCRVVLSRRGVATRLTRDHRLGREDERSRIENSGGFVHYNNGVWRVQGSLAVSRAIGDLHLKDWIVSVPEIEKTQLTLDCEFVILASDGLWDKVTEQEAVDVVSKEEVAMDSCKKLVDISCSRGNRDDITVIVINLRKFVGTAGNLP